MTRIYIALALVAATLAGAWFVYSEGKAAGRAECEAAHAIAADAAAKEIDRREDAGAKASTSMLDYLRANLPPIQEKSRDAIERVRTIYRDRPVAVASCARPDGVQAELDAARQRANAAAGRMLDRTDAAGPADPVAGADGRVGNRSYGPD
jgi:hypothetical protein